MQPASASRAIGSVRVLAVDGEWAADREESLVGEEPLQIRACGPDQAPVDVAVTMTLIGFLRGAHFNVYSRRERVRVRSEEGDV